MALFEGKTPAERNKMIAAIVLPVIALIFIIYMFSGPSGTQTAAPPPKPKPTPKPQTLTAANQVPDDLAPIVCCDEYGSGDDAGRNIFAFYVRPTPTPPGELPTPTATPVPPPPIPLSSIAPQSVFARTGNFTLQLSGDKFGPADRVYIAGMEVQTQYKSMQQLTATVPASAIASPGQRAVAVRTPDGKLYSNELSLNVMQPPAPTYTYVGLLKRKQSNTAVLKDPKGELYSIREGDIIEGRFRVARISESGVDVVDKDLNIKHTLPFVATPGSPGQRGAPGSIQPPSDEGGEEEPQ